MNFFRCRLEKDDSYSILLNGRSLPLPTEKQKQFAANAVQPGEVILGIRPEHIALSEQGFTGEVVVAEMMGSNFHLHVKFGEEEIILVVPDSERDFKKGQTVQFDFTCDRMHIFDPETEQNLTRNQ